MIDCVVAPVDHKFPLADDEVKTTLPPVQKLNGPPAEIVGVAGKAVTVTVVPADVAEVQPPLVTATVYVPDVETVIDCVVSPVDQRFPLADDEVSVTLPPAQKLNGPPAEIVGVAGKAVTVTVVPVEVAEVQPPLVTETVYVPDVETVIDCVVSPVDHKFPLADEEVKTTLPPVQKLNGPPAEIVGVAGKAVTVTVVPAEFAEVQPPLVTATVYVPDVETVIDCVVSPVDQRFPLAEDEVKTTLPPAQKLNGPPAEIVGVAGKAVTVTVVPAEFAEVQPPLVTATVYVPDVETVIDCVVSPVDQRFPLADEEVKTTLPPVQKLNGPPAEIVGVAGKAVTVTVVPAEVADVQPPLVTATVYVPDVETVIDCVVAPVDQRFPLADDEVSVTLPPVQKLNGPLAEIVGVVGKAVTVTVVPAEVAEVQPPLVTETVYVPDVETVIDCVVSPVDQRFPLADEEVSVTLPPAQKLNGPPAEIVGVAGKAVTVTVVPAEVAEVQPPLVTATVYVPDVETVIDCVVAPVDHKFPLADEEVSVTLPPVQKLNGPPAEIVGVAGKAVTVTVVPAEVAEVQPPLVTATVYVPDVETVIDCVVSPVDQRFPLADDEVKTTLPPVQKLNGPPAEIVGVAGKAVTVTVVPAEVAEVQPPLVTATVYVPDVETVIDCVVSPVDQRFPLAEDEVSVTLPPVQKLNGPPAEIVGVAGKAVTVTVVPADVAEVQPPLVTATVYVPDVETVIDCVVAPVDHKFPLADDEVKTTLPPAQKVVGPPAEMVGVAGKAVTVTVVPAEFAEVQPPLVTETVYVPDVETVIDCVVAPVDQRFPLADDEVKTTLPPAQKLNGPPAEIVGVAGNAVTVTVVPAEVAEVQPPLVTATVYVPDVETVIDCVVSPVDQIFPLADEEVSVTLPPAQKLNGPPAEIVGVAGKAVTVTVVPADVAEVQPPLVTATV